MMATLVGVFAAVALLLATVGLYGVMSHVTNQRRTELGIRIAMGAQPTSILALIMAHGFRLLAIGTMTGIAAALMTARLIASHLFGVTPNDPLTFTVVCGVLAGAGLLACAIPAYRATRVDPLIVIRRV